MVHTTATTHHFYYDLQKAGYRGYDRRHYPLEHRASVSEVKPKVRQHVYRSPSANFDEQWRPHIRHVEPKYTNVGPDWQSRLRPVATPNHPDAKPTLPVALIEQNHHFVRPHPQNWQETTNEWKYFPDTPLDHFASKRTHFNEIHLRSVEDLGDENMFMSKIGRKKKVLDTRNGLKKRNDGDKNYHYVEQSRDFYKFGATVPEVHFGREKKPYGDRRSFVPMTDEKIPIIDRREFVERERQREYQTSIDEVVQLERWKPAERVRSAFKVFDLDPNDKNGGKYRPRVR